ncbi:MAG: thiamine-phosphate kinase, partial [Nitriliruptorales bacterium]
MTAEFTLLRALWPRLAGDGPDVPLGAGDDAAVVRIDGRDVAIAVDALVDAVHFDLGISSLADIGWKSVAVNVSDMAAVGARATAAVVALQVPDAMGEAEVTALYEGMGEAGERWDLAIVGGDVVAGPALAVSLTTVGPLV